MSDWKDPDLSVLNVLTAVNVWLDQMVPQQSEAIGGPGILVGNDPQSQFTQSILFKLCYWSWPRSQRSGIKVGERCRCGGGGGQRVRTHRMRLPLGVSSASFSFISIWPWSWLFCSMSWPYLLHVVSGCQYLKWRFVTTLQQKLWNTLNKQPCLFEVKVLRFLKFPFGDDFVLQVCKCLSPSQYQPGSTAVWNDLCCSSANVVTLQRWLLSFVACCCCCFTAPCFRPLATALPKWSR